MVTKVRDVGKYVTVTSTDRQIEYYSHRNDARMSFHPRDKYKMIKVIQIILDKNRWKESRNSWGSVTDTMKYASVHEHLIRAGLADVDYFGNNWYRQDLEDVLNDLKSSAVPNDILKEKNIDKLKEILKGMNLDELIYLHESGVVNE